MITTRKEQQDLFDTIINSLHIIGYLNDEVEEKYRNQAISDLIINMSTLLQKINKADIVEEKRSIYSNENKTCK